MGGGLFGELATFRRLFVVVGGSIGGIEPLAATVDNPSSAETVVALPAIALFLRPPFFASAATSAVSQSKTPAAVA